MLCQLVGSRRIGDKRPARTTRFILHQRMSCGCWRQQSQANQDRQESNRTNVQMKLESPSFRWLIFLHGIYDYSRSDYEKGSSQHCCLEVEESPNLILCSFTRRYGIDTFQFVGIHDFIGSMQSYSAFHFNHRHHYGISQIL